MHLPLILPPVVTGYLLLLSFGRRGPIGAFLDEHFGIVFAFRWTGAALACGIMGFPLMVRAIRLSIEAVDRRLEGAAGTLGANPFWVFLTVTLPLILPGIIAGMILSFAKAMGEFGATITFVSNIPGETQTLPTAIYTFTQVPGGEAGALRLTLVSIAIAMVGSVRLGSAVRRVSGRMDARVTLAVDVQPPARRVSARRHIRERRAADCAVRPIRLWQDNAGQHHCRPRRDRDLGRIAVDGRVLVDTASGHLRADPSAPRRLRLPGCAAVSASDGRPESPMAAGSRRAASAMPIPARSSICSASAICSTAGRPALRRREAARGYRPCLARQPAD